MNCNNFLDTCHFQKLYDQSRTNDFDFHWNTSPNYVVCAFPYIIAFTTDSMEIRLLVNGNLVHTVTMANLVLITSKRDIYFATTAPEFEQNYGCNSNLLKINPLSGAHESSMDIGDNNDDDDSYVQIMQRAQSLHKKPQRNLEERKRQITKSNSCCDSYSSGMSSEFLCDLIVSPKSTTTKTSSSNSSNVNNNKLATSFSRNCPNNDLDNTNPLRIFRIPLVNLAGSHSHYHMHCAPKSTKIESHRIDEDHFEKRDCNDISKFNIIVSRNGDGIFS